jgi:hypothetical protein
MKKSKNFAFILGAIGVIIIIIAVMQGFVIAPVQTITQDCKKTTGCYSADIAGCTYGISTLQKYAEGSSAGITYDCDQSCRVRCPDTNE